MRIQQHQRIDQERFVQVRERGKDQAVFQQIFHEKQTGLTQERLQSLLKQLDQSGVRLSVSRTMRDLMEYKQTIRDFLQEIVQNGYSLEQHNSFQQNGRDKKLILIKQVDTKLLELSDRVFDNQTSSVDILDKLGEIKGLLVNLYM
ncbi:YaaR family protein [Neobacillus notoginsengisoli]|uniref:YaaR family protein n=1 Tax=Neobacillus notoginsengisoli TaxID=1578198 RepID=UPI001314A55A|nr:YaaR family protein [Neobacillus notoginsengisoli]